MSTIDSGHYGDDLARRTKRLWTDEEKRSICFQTVAPLADGGLIHPERGGDLLALQPFGTGQHDPRPHRQRLRGLATRGKPLQLGPLDLAQDNLRCTSPTRYATSPRCSRERLPH